MARVPSLSWHLFVWLLPSFVITMIASTFVAYNIADDVLVESLDHGLIEATHHYIKHLQDHPDRITDDMPSLAQRMLLVSGDDRVYFTLRDNAGTPLAGDPQLPDLGEWGSDESPVFFQIQYAGNSLRGTSVAFNSGGRDLHLHLATTTLKRDRMLSRILFGTVAPQTILFFLTLTLLWFGVRRGLDPLTQLRQDISRRSQSDLTPLNPDSVPLELRPLVVETNKLLLRLDLTLKSHQHFIADAAHQLRTPIAGLLAQVEAAVLCSTETSALPHLAASARRLSRLVGQLLSLSKAADGFAMEQDRLDLATLIGDAADDWLSQALRRNIDVQFELYPAMLTGSAHALQEAIANLVDNAIRHGRCDGTIVIRCGTRGDSVFLQIDDDGPGIPEGLRTAVFERFYRPQGTAGEGCGLGLAIVQEILRRHGGHIVLAQSPDLHGLRVDILLPAAPGTPAETGNG